MNKFIGRQQELNALNAVLTQRGTQFILLYGRRRVGKTALVLHWAERAPFYLLGFHARYASPNSRKFYEVGLGC